jgi:squalene-hopene/tetraprenyl-beta-curcumene cyclase
MTASEEQRAAEDGREGLEARAAHACERAVRWLLARQHPSGYWHEPLEANAAMDAEYVFMNRLIGRERPDLERRLAEHLLARQQADGGWAQWAGGPGHVSNTIEAYFALKLTGHTPDEPALARAREFVLAHGGLARAGVATRVWLACLGQFPWSGVPAIPVELVLLPPWAPGNVHAMASWARSVVVPLSLLLAYQPLQKVPDAARMSELWARPPARGDLVFPRSRELVTVRNLLLAADRAAGLLGRSPWKPLRRRAVARAIEWVLRHQDKNGQWGGLQLAMATSLVALHAIGFASDHPVMVSGVQAVDDLLTECDGTLLCQPTQAPTWDTALAARALLAAGLEPAHPALARAGEWLLARQVFRPGDWAVQRPALDPGGFPFGFANDWYPDVPTSAAVLGVLQELPLAATPTGRRAVARGLNWTLGMQSRGGGFAACDADSTARWMNELPVGDMGAMVDPPTGDVTGQALELMGASGYGSEFGRARTAVDFVRRAQRADGAWAGRWGVNCLWGTWTVLAGLAAIGEDLRAPHVRRAVEWLSARQNPDGGWGETPASYDADGLAGRGESTPSQTAWAVMALLAADGPRGEAVARGVDWLVRTQDADGTWVECAFTGTAFPHHIYLRFHLYRHSFPLMALGRYRQALGAS